MIKVLGLDFETQSADAKETNITEIGAVMVEVEGNDFKYTKEFSALCYEPEYPPQVPKIVQLTGITDEMLKEQGRPREEIMREFLPLYGEADIIMCHKIAFDKTVLESTCARYGIELPKKEYLCTLTNVDYPKHLTCHKLSHLAYEMGLYVDPRTLHRATDDVKLMLELILTKFKFEKVLEYARTPWTYAKADVCGPWVDGGKQTGEAKLLGFSFENVKGTDYPKWPKTWVTRVKGEPAFNELVEQARAGKAPFRVSRIEGIN